MVPKLLAKTISDSDVWFTVCVFKRANNISKEMSLVLVLYYLSTLYCLLWKPLPCRSVLLKKHTSNVSPEPNVNTINSIGTQGRVDKSYTCYNVIWVRGIILCKAKAMNKYKVNLPRSDTVTCKWIYHNNTYLLQDNKMSCVH
jgi:hypothetical protein